MAALPLLRGYSKRRFFPTPGTTERNNQQEAGHCQHLNRRKHVLRYRCGREGGTLLFNQCVRCCVPRPNIHPIESRACDVGHWIPLTCHAVPFSGRACQHKKNRFLGSHTLSNPCPTLVGPAVPQKTFLFRFYVRARARAITPKSVRHVPGYASCTVQRLQTQTDGWQFRFILLRVASFQPFGRNHSGTSTVLCTLLPKAVAHDDATLIRISFNVQGLFKRPGIVHGLLHDHPEYLLGDRPHALYPHALNGFYSRE